MNSKVNSIFKLFNLMGYEINSIDQIETITLNHKSLQSPELIKKFSRLIPELRKIYDSHTLTCLHGNSTNKQKFPAINMLRQLLKCNGYKLKPKVISHGYNPITKNKILERFFVIEKFNPTSTSLDQSSDLNL